MDNRLSCDIVRDLLPSYADGLTNDATNEAVEAHLAQCPDCGEALRLMGEPELPPARQGAEVDYLKKVRRRTSRVGMICGIVMMVVGMLLIFSRVFFIGNLAGATDASFNISVTDNIVSVTGNLTSSASAVARVEFEESAGMVNMKVYTAPKAFFNSGVINERYQANNDIVSQVRCGGLIFWEEGAQISPTAAQLYAAINPFIGDMPANGRIASILGVFDQLGPYSNELHTAAEPYGWTLILEEPLAREEESAARDIMTADSYVMLATIDNMSFVTWQYETEDGSREYTVTADDATAYLGREVKEWANSASSLQSLVESLSLKWSGVREGPPII